VRAVHKPNFVPWSGYPDSGQRSFILDVRCRTPHATYPEASGGQPSNASLFGLAPDGVYQAFPVTWKTGALLPHRFTLTSHLKNGWRSALCCTFLHVTATPRYGASCPVVFGLSSGFFNPATAKTTLTVFFKDFIKVKKSLTEF